MLPEFIIIGAMKSGTGSLHYYLGLHPDISVSKWKELDFFVADRNWRRGRAWYEDQFPDTGKLRGEASPKYTFYPRHDGVPERMASIVPDARLVYLVRDPVARIVSHWVHLVEEGPENRSLDAALADMEDSPYIWRSRYWTQLLRYLDHFSPEQILIVAQEDLLRSRRKTLNRVFEFLGVRPFSHPNHSRICNASGRKRRRNRLGCALATHPPLQPLQRLNPRLRWHIDRIVHRPFSTPIPPPHIRSSIRSQLDGLFREEILSLEAFAGRRFDWPAAPRAG